VPQNSHLRDDSKQVLSDRETYNVVTDIVGGPNVRLKDNLYQGLAILVCTVLGPLIGFFAMNDRMAGAVLGGFIGLLVGLFGSGIFIMILRAVMHSKGKHN
jgi:hypothetical protein